MLQQQRLQVKQQLLNLRQLRLQLLTVRAQLGELVVMRFGDPLLKPLAVFFEELVWAEEAKQRKERKTFRFFLLGHMIPLICSSDSWSRLPSIYRTFLYNIGQICRMLENIYNHVPAGSVLLGPCLEHLS